MPIVRQLRYRKTPSGRDEGAHRQMASAMQLAGESALTVDLTKTDLEVLNYYAGITHLTIHGGGKKWDLNRLPVSIQDLCLLEVQVETFDSFHSLSDLRVFDYRIGNIHHAKGLEKCTKLQVLQFLRIDGFNNLEFISNLEKLEWIKISECMDVERFPDLGRLRSLRRII